MEDRWKNRKKTGIVEKMRHSAGITIPELSNILCTSKEYINNKKNRNSFSFEDILKIATFCGYRIRFDRVNDAANSFVIDPNEFLENDESYLKVVVALKEKRLREMDDKSKVDYKPSEEMIFKNFVILDKKEFGRKVLDGGVSFKHVRLINTSCGCISGCQILYNMPLDRFVEILNDPELYLVKYIGEEIAEEEAE